MENNDQNNQQNDVQPSAEELNSILAAVELNPSLKNDPEVKNLLDLAAKLGNPDSADDGKKEPEKKDKDKKPDSNNADVVDDNNDENIDDETGLLKNTSKSKPFSFSNFDDVKKFVKTDIGIDTEKEGWESSFKESISKWRKDSQSKKEVEEKVENTQKFFQIIGSNHPSLAAAIKAVAAGEDPDKAYQGALSAIDVTKNFDDYEPKRVLKHYFPETFSDEDFKNREDFDDEDEYKVAQTKIKSHLASARKLYDVEKSTELARRAGKQTEQQRLAEEYDKSVIGSVKVLKESFPELKDKAISTTEKILKGGDDAILSVFREKNGMLKPDAAKLITLALTGEKAIQSAQKVIDAKNDIIKKLSKDLEGFVSKHGAKPANSGAKGTKTVDEAANEIVRTHQGLISKQTY